MGRSPSGQTTRGPFTPAQIKILRDSFGKLKPKGPALMRRFYDLLFERYPQVKPLFANTTQKKQEKHLLDALALTVKNLDKPDILLPVLQELGRRHEGYGAAPDHYAAVAETLLEVMQEFMGTQWTKKIQNTWTTALNVIAGVMLGEYRDKEGTTMATKKAKSSNELSVLKSAIDKAGISIMMVDRDLIITYANESTMKMVQDNLAVFQQVYPGFDPNKLMGLCIDQFHKKPAHQRQMLSEPNNFP